MKVPTRGVPSPLLVCAWHGGSCSASMQSPVVQSADAGCGHGAFSFFFFFWGSLLEELYASSQGT